MATITQNNVTFSNVQVGSMVSGWDTKYSNANNVLDGKYDPDPENIEKSFNAIEIDWNGAKLGSTTINTTGQLLSYITTLSNRIAALEQNGGGSSKPTARLVGATERSNAWYNNYHLLKVKVQTSDAGFPVTVTNNDSSVLLIDNTYYNYNSSVNDQETRAFTSVQLNNFSSYITIVASKSSMPTTNKLTFSTAETSTYAPTSIDFNYSFTKKA